ncbi:MAG: flagellar hook-basal body complex protein FliE [Oxalobacteraceae bacterium]|jgi:flagellar hook-basal body complex protein FliE|nr:flagellar hook-basal body complex protein FliE [Gammaproteobacteria bacterium]NCW85552.1 flagellar hook-basal body complex protein FliE [Oxalobacteraceae bacterium]
MAADALGALQQQMKIMADLAAGNVASATPAAKDGEPDFQSALYRAILKVNESQNMAQQNAQSFASGDSGMSLEEVMVSLQKANISFQTMVAVRNRLVDAYKEVTNLQV